jgi:hypothetical protein
MWRVVLIGLALAAVAGCGKNSSAPASPARQAIVEKVPALKRLVTDVELYNLRLNIDATTAGGNLPSKETILAELRKDDPKSWRGVQEGAIILTGTRSRKGIWAYTAEPQPSTGKHRVVTEEGLESLTPEELKQRLGKQGQ